MLYRFGKFELDADARELRKDGVRVDTEPKAFELLLHLIRQPQRAVSKDELQNELWPRAIVTETALTRCVMKARRAVGDDANKQAVIRTVHGHGYRFVAELQGETKDSQTESPAAPVANAVPPNVDRRPRWPWLAAAVALLVVVIGISQFRNNNPLPAIAGSAVAVLPVSSDIDDASLDWVRLGLMGLFNRMLTDAGVDVASDDIVLSAIGDVPVPRPLDRPFVDRIAAVASVSNILTVSLRRQGGLFHLTAALTHTDGSTVERVIVADSPTSAAADMAAVMGRIVAGDDGNDERRLRRVSIDPFVNEVYARGLALELEGQLAEARSLFELAAKQEPELFWLQYEIALCTRDLREWAAAEQQFEALLARAETDADDAARIATLNSWGVAYLKQQRFADAEALFLEAQAAARDSLFAADRAAVLINLALLASNRDDRAGARQYYEQARSAFEEAEQRLPPIFANNYAGLLIGEGDLEGARSLAEEAVAGFRLQGHRRNEATALTRLGKIERRLGELESSLQHHKQALAIHQQQANDHGALIVLMSMTNLYRDKGDLTRARLNAIDVLERSQRFSDDSLLADAQMFLAQVEEKRGDYVAARAAYRSAMEGFAAIGTPPGLRYAKEGVARTAYRTGDLDAASGLAADLLTSAEARGDPRAVTRARQLRANIDFATDRRGPAIDSVTQLLAAARDRDDLLLADALAVDLARFYLDDEQPEAAEPLLASVRREDAEHTRLSARLAYAQGDRETAIATLLDLRSRVGEAWRDSDDALLASFADDSGER